MVESHDAMKALVKERKAIMKKYPNLVEHEGRTAFLHVKGARPMPTADASITEQQPKRTFWGQLKYRAVTRPFERSTEAAAEKRKKIRIAMPRVLNMYSTAPFFRTYLEVLGLSRTNIVFSSPSSEEGFAEGGKYGSVDPCYPSKVVQAHIHELLFHEHPKKALDAIFFPILTHVPQFLEDAQDAATCPIVAGTPSVIKAAFTKEKDFFAERDIRYLAPALSFAEPVRMKDVLFETFGALLECTRDENDFAVEEGLAALRRFDEDIQAKGKAILDQVEADGSLAILVVGRPYHLDPGLHHGIPDEFQVLGYPILSMRSIPKDPAWLRRFYADDLEKGRTETPLSIADVWPENYSANSAAKVWAAKFAARHPNVVLLDLSSFKCGHDAPTYGIIDGIVERSATPHSALHDLDANKPGGSIKIRVKTYAHSLTLYREKLEDLADKNAELARRLDEKRLELLRMKQEELAKRRTPDAGVEAQIRALSERLRAYQAPEKAPEPERGLIRLGKKTSKGQVVRV